MWLKLGNSLNVINCKHGMQPNFDIVSVSYHLTD